MDKITMKLPMYSHYDVPYHPYKLVMERGYTKEELLRAMLHPKTLETLTQTGFELMNDAIEDETIVEFYSLGHIDDISTLDQGYLMVRVYKDKIKRVNYLLQNGCKIGMNTRCNMNFVYDSIMDDHCDWMTNMIITGFVMVDPKIIKHEYEKIHLSKPPQINALCYVK